MKRASDGHTRRLFLPARKQTIRGIYRIYPLQPGEYVLSVIEQSLVMEEREGGMMQTVGNNHSTPTSMRMPRI